MKRLILSCIVIFFFIAIFEFLLHGVMLGQTYKDTMQLWRPEDQMVSFLGWMYGGQLLFAIIFCVIFFRYVKDRSLAAGVRYGLLVGLLMSSTSLIFYAVMPLPLNLVLAWIGGGIVEVALAGGILALVAGKDGQSLDTGV
jgi:MFS family permease